MINERFNGNMNLSECHLSGYNNILVVINLFSSCRIAYLHCTGVGNVFVLCT